MRVILFFFILGCATRVLGSDVGRDVILLQSANSFVIRFDSDSPNFSFHPLHSNGRPLWNLYFSMNWTAIREVNRSTATTLAQASLINTTWTREEVQTPFSNSVVLNTTLSNGAVMNIKLINYFNSTVINYGHLNYEVPSDSIKLSITLVNWPFLDASNWLNLDISYNTNSLFTSNYDEDLDMRFLNVTLPRFQVNMKFIKFAIVDGTEVDINPIPLSFMNPYSLPFTYEVSSGQVIYYDPDFSVLLNSEPNCASLDDCSGHGTCVDDNRCDCDSNWSGETCSIAQCQDGCNGHGTCVPADKPYCECNNGWVGLSCGVADCPGSPFDCSGRGECAASYNTPKCTCREGWSGADCTIATCTGKCGNGKCNELLDPPRCICNAGFTGEFCMETSSCTTNISVCVHGKCNADSGLCECNANWIGDKCDIPLCAGYNESLSSGNCNFLGECLGTQETPVCQCRAGRQGPDCSIALCPDSCSGHGTCREESIVPICLCEEYWDGENCATEIDEEENSKKKSGKSKTTILVIVFVVLAAVVVASVSFGSFVYMKKRKQKFLQKFAPGIKTENTNTN